MEFPKQEYWSGLLFPSPGDLPNPGVEPASPAVQVDSLPSPTKEALFPGTGNKFLKFCFPCLTFPGDSDNKESDCNAGELDSVPESGRSPGEGNGYPLQYSFLENPWKEKPGGLLSMGLQRVGEK